MGAVAEVDGLLLLLGCGRGAGRGCDATAATHMLERLFPTHGIQHIRKEKAACWGGGGVSEVNTNPPTHGGRTVGVLNEGTCSAVCVFLGGMGESPCVGGWF